MRNVTGGQSIRTQIWFLENTLGGRQTHSHLQAKQAAYSPDLHGEKARACVLHTEGPDLRMKLRGTKERLNTLIKVVNFYTGLHESFPPLSWACVKIRYNFQKLPLRKLNTNLCCYRLKCICCTVLALIWSTVVVIWSRFATSGMVRVQDPGLRWGGRSWGTGWGPDRRTCTGRWSAPSASSAASALTAWWEPPLAEGKKRQVVFEKQEIHIQLH